MKKIKPILKWTGIILLLIVASLSVITAARQHVKYDAPYPSVTASKDSAVIARGKHLVFSIAHCADCHSTANADSLINLGQDVPLSGGVVFDLPVGKIYSKNITADKETGIGNYTDAEIARALYYGVHPDGTAIFDFMPFHNVSEEDMTAIISYLRMQKPVKNVVPQNSLNVLGKVVNAFMVKPVGPTGQIPKTVKPDTTEAYGKYLVTSVGNCSGCHTQRSLSGEYTGDFLAGGNPMETTGKPTLTPPNLTTDSSSRIFSWTLQNFTDRMRMGKLIPYSHMPWNTYKNMTDDELKAIYKFLKTVKPAKTKPAA